MMKLSWLIVFALLVCACGSADKPEPSEFDDANKQHTDESLLQQTREYRLTRAKNYLLLVGSWSAATGRLSAKNAELALGVPSGWNLSFDAEVDSYVLSPKTITEDPQYAIDPLQEISTLPEENFVDKPRRNWPAQEKYLLELLSRLNAEENTVVRGTELWAKPILSACAKYARETSATDFKVWDVQPGLVGNWFAFSGEVELRAGKIICELWGILPKWGYAIASLDMSSGELTIEHNEMSLE